MDKIHTKFGSATIHNEYYVIRSRKEGNRDKRLHRLIYEDYYGVTLLPWVNIHHVDGNKLNNNITNLRAMTASEHRILHNDGEINPAYRSDLKNEDLYLSYLDMGSYEKVAKKFNTTIDTIKRRIRIYCNENNLELPQAINATRRPDLDNEQLWKDYQRLGTYTAVAKIYDCDYNTVRNRVNKYKKENGL